MTALCLASGGGWQSILYACAGANVTVVDLSPAMLRMLPASLSVCGTDERLPDQDCPRATLHATLGRVARCARP